MKIIIEAIWLAIKCIVAIPLIVEEGQELGIVAK
jgi:hypothetical protein